MPHLSTVRDGSPDRRLPGRNLTKADIVVYRHERRRVALKDYRPRPWWIRWTLGRWLTGRECRAYRRLDGLAGVAPFLGRVDAYALATEWVEAKPLRDLDGAPPAASLESLERILAAIHARGVALGDLHHRDVLLADDGSVTIVDLATAWVGPESSPVFRRLRDQDRVALARLRERFWGVDARQAFADCSPEALVRYRRARRLKRRWQRLRGKGREAGR